MTARPDGSAPPPARPRARRRLAMAGVAIGLGLLVPVVLAEVVLRFAWPDDWVISDARLAASVETAMGSMGRFRADDRFGHWPLPGGKGFDDLGLLRGQGTLSGSAARSPGVERVLFLGDSVTARSQIVDALRALRTRQGVELLNAGVEGWNPIQEVEYYFRVLAPLEPDHIVLTLHNNDLSYTPGAVFANGFLVLCNPGRPVHLAPWLYRISWLYRLWINAQVGEAYGPTIYVREAAQVEAALRRLRDGLRPEQRLSVVLLPHLLSSREWAPHHRESRRLAVEMLARLEIRTFDLLPCMDAAMEQGLVLRSQPDDAWHPGPVAGAMFAQELLGQGLFADDPAPWVSVDATVLDAGGVQHVTVSAGAASGGFAFRVLSADDIVRTPPNVVGHRFPLAADERFRMTVAGATDIVPAFGVLDADGNATIAITVPEPRRDGNAVRWQTVVLQAPDGSVRAISPALPLVTRRPAAAPGQARR